MNLKRLFLFFSLSATIPIQRIHSLVRYVNCCYLSYQYPGRPLYPSILQTVQDDRLVSFEPFFRDDEKQLPAGYVFVFPEEIVVSFRGTMLDGKIRSELWNNFNQGIVKKTFAGYETGIHQGAWKEYEKTRKNLWQHLEKARLFQDGNRSFIAFTGHSLGAISQIAALDYYNHLKTTGNNLCKDSRIQCIHFGGYKILTHPKIFQRLGIENIRVWFKNDPVSYYPPSQVLVQANTESVLLTDSQKFEHGIYWYREFLRGI